MMTNITGKPGIRAAVESLPREVFYSGRENAGFLLGPLTIDGTASGNALNVPSHLLQAGMVFGRNTPSQKWESSIIGLTTVAYVDGALTITVSPATAAELVRRIGNAGTFQLIGPAVADTGPIVETAVAYTAVVVATGVITVPDLNVNKVAGAIIAPNNTARTPVSVMCDVDGLKLVDQDGVTRVDVYGTQLWAGGGVINTAMILNYPADLALRAWLKAAIRVVSPAAMFSDDFVMT
jgi:hypothetical protein